MAEEAKKEATQSEPEAAPKKSGSMMKYIILGGGGLVAVLAIAFGIVLLMGGDEPTPAPAPQVTSEPASPAKTNGTAAATPIVEPVALTEEASILALLEQDESVMDAIVKNLEALDYEPTASDLGIEEEKMSADDSAEAVNWIEAEKKRLSEWDSQLAARQKELDALDRSVSKKMLKLEQAESARIAQLAKLYDGMDARAVAQLIANLDDETVVSLLPRMKPKNASATLQLMPAQRAARLSKQMITIAEN
jgi:flagellar motility protein MotE (MotC chaperone)